MSTSIDQAFVRQYESEVWHVFQRQGGRLRFAVRTKTNITGKSTTFQKVGKGTATTKARHGTITPMNIDHTPVECPIYDFYAGDWADKLDEAKVQHDERMVLAKAGAWALGRKVDDQILEKMDETTQSTFTFTISSIQAIENSLLGWIGELDANDVPDDGGRYATLSTKAWQAAMKVESFASADYVGPDGLPFKRGAPVTKWKDWMGVMWTVHTGGPGHGTATSKMFAWHKDSVGYATGAHPMNVAENPNGTVMADISWVGPRAAHWINHWMSGGGCLIDDTGVIEANINDTTTLPTS